MRQIDVTLPVFRSLTTVGETIVAQQIDSILGQRDCAVRLLILDNCSDDGTYEMLRHRYAGDPRVVIRQNERNLGQIGSIERLLSLVEAPYFATADHDDVWVDDKLARALDQLESDGVDLVYSDLSVVDKDLRVIAASSLAFTNCPPVRGRAPLDVLIKNPIHGCTMVARREVAQRSLPFPPGVPIHDRWLGLVSCAGRGIGYVAQPLVLYRQHEGNATGDVPFSRAGFQRRSGGRWTQYLRSRLDGRIAYLRGWMALDSRPSSRWLDWYYNSAPWTRILLAPGYAFFVLARARQIGLRNVLVDALLTSLAPSTECEAPSRL